MIRKIIITIFLVSLFNLRISAQTFSKEYWKEIAANSDAVVIGVVEERLKLIRPEKYKPNSDGSIPSDREFTVGELFRVKVTQKLKGKIRGEKEEKNKYIYIFIPYGMGLHNPGNLLLESEEYVFFLEPNMNEKEFIGLETVEFRPNADSIRKAFEMKSTYLIVYGQGGIVQIKADKAKLIKEIKNAM